MIKKYLLIGLLFLIPFVNKDIFAEDMEVILEGSTSDNGFNVKKSNGESITRFGGDGNVGVETGTPHEKLSVNGVVQSLIGGFKFPEDSTQKKAGKKAKIFWGNGQSLSIIAPDPDLEQFKEVDFSSIVGKNRSVILLKINSGDSGIRDFAFRRKGDPIIHILDGNGVSHGMCYFTGSISYVLVPTDENGIAEWRTSAGNKSNGNGPTVVVEVILYIR